MILVDLIKYQRLEIRLRNPGYPNEWLVFRTVLVRDDYTFTRMHGPRSRYPKIGCPGGPITLIFGQDRVLYVVHCVVRVLNFGCQTVRELLSIWEGPTPVC